MSSVRTRAGATRARPRVLGRGVLLGNTYLLGPRINLGGMGEVFEATHARLPGRYAVKILRPELLGNREAFARFCREAEVMSELRHPNVVQIYDFNTTPEGRPYFVMEHLEGRDLEARLTQSGPMPLPAAVRVVDAVASALATAHAHGIVHRDLKPANIFLVAIDGQIDELVKVLDFGISKIRSAGTLLSSPTDMIGSPAYMSPEQARGASDEIDGRSDQFALGAITYRMLTGFEPFQGDDIASLLYQVVHEEAPRLARTLPAWWDTRALQAVLDRALAKEPAQRFSGMMEMARAFEAASEQTLSHEISERGTINLGATLIAAPPPPPLRLARTPAAAGAIEAAEPSEIEDSAPPIRTPGPEPIAAGRVSRADGRGDRAATPGRDFSIDEGATFRGGRCPAARPGKSPTARAAAGHAPPGGPGGPRAAGDRRRAGRHRYLPSPHLRRAAGAGAGPSGAGAEPPPAPVNRRPTRRGPGGRRARAATPAGDGPRRGQGRRRPRHRPSSPKQTGQQIGQHQARRGRAFPSPPPAGRNRASSTDRGASISPPAPPVDDQFNPFAPPSNALAVRRRAAWHRALAVRAAEPVPAADRPPPSAAPPPDTLQNQFAIPPPAPTEDSPSRDLVPPAEPEREPSPGPAIPPAPRTLPRGPAGAPRTRGPADQPMAPTF